MIGGGYSGGNDGRVPMIADDSSTASGIDVCLTTVSQVVYSTSLHT